MMQALPRKDNITAIVDIANEFSMPDSTLFKF